MAKELPYFRFTPQEWQNGDISLESYELRGLFIEICSYYWVKDCSITIAMLEKRYNNEKSNVKELFDLGIIQQQNDSEYIQISFLDEQYDILSERRKRRQKAGSKGGKRKSSNARAMLQQKSSYKDKDKDNNKEKDNNKTEKSNDLTEARELLRSIHHLFDKKHYDTEPKKNKWLDTIEKLHRIDGYSYDSIKSVILFAKSDDFWTKNVQSVLGLRKKNGDGIMKFDNILAKMPNDKKCVSIPNDGIERKIYNFKQDGMIDRVMTEKEANEFCDKWYTEIIKVKAI